MLTLQNTGAKDTKKLVIYKTLLFYFEKHWDKNAAKTTTVHLLPQFVLFEFPVEKQK